MREGALAVSIQIVGGELARDFVARIACKQASYTVHLTLTLPPSEGSVH